MLFGLNQGEGYEACFGSEQIRSFGFQEKCLRLTTSTSPTKKNLVMNETRHSKNWMVEVERINSRKISYSV